MNCFISNRRTVPMWEKEYAVNQCGHTSNVDDDDVMTFNLNLTFPCSCVPDIHICLAVCSFYHQAGRALGAFSFFFGYQSKFEWVKKMWPTHEYVCEEIYCLSTLYSERSRIWCWWSMHVERVTARSHRRRIYSKCLSICLLKFHAYIYYWNGLIRSPIIRERCPSLLFTFFSFIFGWGSLYTQSSSSSRSFRHMHRKRRKKNNNYGFAKTFYRWYSKIWQCIYAITTIVEHMHATTIFCNRIRHHRCLAFNKETKNGITLPPSIVYGIWWMGCRRAQLGI